MVRHLLTFEWKKFRRSSFFQRNLAISILFILFALYMMAAFAIIGVAAYFGLKEEFPNESPIILVNNYLIFWFLLDFIYRFFFQKLPFMEVKPLMLQNLRKKKILHFLLIKSAVSVYTILPLFFFIPFTISALLDGVSWYQILPWLLAMIAIELVINFVIFIMDKSNKVFYAVLVFLLLLVGAYAMNWIDVPRYSGKIFNAFFEQPYLTLSPIAGLIVLYRLNMKYLLKNFYLDGEIIPKNKEAKIANLTWLDNLGTFSIFLKNDIRLLLRNTRTKQVLFLSSFFLLYGLLIYPNEMYNESDTMMVMFSTFITGGFMMTFGQSVPAWDSEYYKLLMSQNISYYKYLDSKWLLMVVSVLASFILSIPYLFMGLKYFEIIAATALFNVGINSYLTLIGGIYNRGRINLNEKVKAFGTKQSFNLSQILIAIPKIFGPILFFYPFSQFYDFETGLIALSVVSLLGLFLKKPILKQIEKIYQEEKYETIQAFSEK